MNKAFALAVLMSAAALGTAHAREMITPQKDVNVIYVDPNEHHENRILAVPDNIIDPTQSQINQAQAEVRRDPALRAALLKDKSNESKAEAERAMAWLRKAVTAGFDDVADLKKNPDLAALRDREDFKKLLADLEAKAAPRATPP